MTGELLSVHHRFSDANAFLWGHQGYEYVDLGRVWQTLLFVGLLFWFFILSAGAIGLFYGAGLTWGQHTHLSIVEYWRWWVIHLWVEANAPLSEQAGRRSGRRRWSMSRQLQCGYF